MDYAMHCAKCGQVIPAERVKAIPGIKLCVACQSGVEHAPSPPPASYSGEFCPWCKKKGIEAPLVWRRPRDPTVMGEFLSCSRLACPYVDRESMRNLAFSDHEKASPRQVAFLVKRGMAKAEAKLLSAKAASRQIDQLKGGTRRRPNSISGKEQAGNSYEISRGNSGVAPGGKGVLRMAWPAETQVVQHRPSASEEVQCRKAVGVGDRPKKDAERDILDSPAGMTPAEQLRKTKVLYPHTHEEWTPSEERLLSVVFLEGYTIDQIADILEREPGGIRSRLIMLGLVENDAPK